MRKTLSFLLLAGVMAIGPLGRAEDSHDTELDIKPRIDLPARVMEILREEMRTVDQAIGEIVHAIPRGDWHTTAHTAQRIQESYIMQKKLTAHDREQLHGALPEGFRHLDAQFHRRAGNLAQAAKQQDAELVSFYFYRLVDSCMQCHSRYAIHRFPGLGMPAGQGHDH